MACMNYVSVYQWVFVYCMLSAVWLTGIFNTMHDCTVTKCILLASYVTGLTKWSRIQTSNLRLLMNHNFACDEAITLKFHLRIH